MLGSIHKPEVRLHPQAHPVQLHSPVSTQYQPRFLLAIHLHRDPKYVTKRYFSLRPINSTNAISSSLCPVLSPFRRLPRSQSSSPVQPAVVLSGCRYRHSCHNTVRPAGAAPPPRSGRQPIDLPTLRAEAPPSHNDQLAAAVANNGHLERQCGAGGLKSPQNTAQGTALLFFSCPCIERKR